MAASTYRIFIASNSLGRMQQISRPSRYFYDVVPAVYLDADHSRWYRIASTSSEYVFTTLSRAAPREITDYVTLTQLGAHMRLFSGNWYVNAKEIKLDQALNLTRLALTGPKALAIAIALLVFGYMLFMIPWSQWTGEPLPDVRPLARFSSIAMLLFLGIEFLLDRLQDWMQESLGVW